MSRLGITYFIDKKIVLVIQLCLVFLLFTTVLNAQTANFSIAKREGCAPLDAVNFTDISTGGTVTSRQWDLGKGVINNNSPTVGNNYGTPGKYIITLTVTFSGGIIKTKQDSVIVHPNPVAAFETADTAGCAPYTIQLKDLSNTPTGSITNWTWNIGPGNSDKQNPSYLFDANGDYAVKLLVINSWGCKSELAGKEKYVHVYDKVQAAFSIPVSYSCDTPFIASFNNSTTGGGAIVYNWSFGDGDSSKEFNPTHRYIHPGVYTVQLTAKNGSKCSGTYTLNNSVFVGKPTVSISAPDSVCSNTPVVFSGNATPASSLNMVNWKWVFPGGTISFGRDVSYTFTAPGKYDVLLIAYYNINCPDTTYHSVIVKQGLKPDFSVDKIIGCSTPFTVNFTSLSSPASGLKYNWDFGDGSGPSTLPSPSNTYNTSGYFTVTLTITDTSVASGCTTVMQKVNLIRIAKPSVDFTYVPPDGCMPLPVNTTARVTNVIDPIVSYIWDFGEGIPVTTTIPNANFVYTAAGSYYIKLKVVTQQGCTDSSKAKAVTVTSLCNDDGSGSGGGGGGGGGGGFTIKKTCADRYTISFADTVSNSMPVSWDFGDGSPLYTSGELKNITHSFSKTSKNYVVTVTGRDTVTDKIYTSQKRVIIIDEKAKFNADITTICKDKKVNFATIGIDSSNVDLYSWNFGDGSKASINNKSNFLSYGSYLNGNLFHVYAAAGDYYVTLSITDKLGCVDSFRYEIPIVVKGPVAGFMPSVKTSCDKNFVVDFKDTSIQNGSVPITEWAWKFGNGIEKIISVKDSVIHQTYTNNSYYQEFNASLTIKDSLGCQNTTSQIIKSFYPKANFSSNDTLKCGNLKVTLFNNSSAYLPTYFWNFGDGTSAASDNGSHTYSKEGFYDISLVIADNNGCKDSITKSAFIKLVRPKADFSIADTGKCGPISISFFDSSNYASKYKWDFGDKSSIPINKNVAHLYNPGIYQVRLFIEGISGCTDSITKTIRIKGPVGKLSTSNNIGCAPYVFSMNVKGTNISKYSWDYGDGSKIVPSQDSIVIHTYRSAGKVLPNVVITSPENCSILLKADTVIVDSVKAAFTRDKAHFCDSGYVQFDNYATTTSFSSLKAYKWNFGDGSLNSSPIPTLHKYDTPGNYNVSLAVESLYGCKDTATIEDAVIVRKSPSATITTDTIICLTTNSFLTLNSNIKTVDSILSYLWKIDNEVMSPNASPMINYRIPGQHTISLNVKTNTGCEAAVNKTIVIDSVKALFSINQNVFCGLAEVNFKNESLHMSDVQYKWQFGDDGVSNNENPVHQYVSSGLYSPKLTVQSVMGCKDSFMVDQPIKVYKAPQVDISGDDERCAEVLLHYAANVLSEDTVSAYTWKLNNNTIGTTNSINNFFVKAGSYDIAVTINTKNGCTVTGTKHLTIDPLPIPAASPDTTICIGSTIQLHANDGVQYQWTPTTGLQQSTSANPIANPKKNTTYYVTVTNGSGCIKKDTVEVLVNERVDLKVSNNAIICRGEKVDLIATGNTKQFSWSPLAGLNNPNIANPVASPDQNTTYQVIGYSTNVCKNDTGFVKIVVGDIPRVDLGPDITVDAGSMINLKPVVSSDVVKYFWSPKEGLSCDACFSPTVISDKDKTYKLMVETIYGCQASDEVNIKVLCGKGAVYIPNAFSPNGDGKNDVFYIMGYGIQKVKSFRIFNRWGQQVFNRENIAANDRSNGWNGLVNNQPVLGESAYVYIADVICNEGKTVQFKGTVILIR